MMKLERLVLGGGIASSITLAGWGMFVIRGKQFALRDPLREADAIIVLAGTRGNIKYLEGKIQTAVNLYHQGLAPYVICSGRFSVKVTESPQLIPEQELVAAANQGRIQPKDVPNAACSWDEGLGAVYMCQQAIKLGVPANAAIAEAESLHTRENAECVLRILQERNMHRVILVTSPFHQLRTYLTFAKVFQPYNIEIINHYADTGEWSPATWFLSKEHRQLVRSEMERIKIYREKGDIL
jgi:uncharacterized SAM-binding protein YcdF (DUF218 family)